MKRMVNSGVLVWALCVTAFITMGVTIPNVFVAGNTISSAQVNANFTAVKTAIDTLEAGQPVALATIDGDAVAPTALNFGGRTTTGATVARILAADYVQYDITFTGTYPGVTNADDLTLIASMETSGTFDVGVGGGVLSANATTIVVRVFQWSTSGATAPDPVDRDVSVVVYDN
jgi:hypothetical protein